MPLRRTTKIKKVVKKWLHTLLPPMWTWKMTPKQRERDQKLRIDSTPRQNPSDEQSLENGRSRANRPAESIVQSRRAPHVSAVRHHDPANDSDDAAQKTRRHAG